MKKIQQLNQGWTMRTPEGAAYPTSIPGSMYQVLYENGAIEDPYWRANEEEYLSLSEKDYSYFTEFDADVEILDKPSIILEFEGIDTLADIRLNGVVLGRADNMHRQWHFDVKGSLRPRGNRLVVDLHSPVRFIRDEYRKCVCDGAPECMKGFPHLRKAHYMFGWDWGPRLPDLGIFRSVNLCGYDESRIKDVHILQHHSDGRVVLEVRVDTETPHDTEEEQYVVILTDPNGHRSEYGGSPREITIQNPELWWPNGYGAQPLYEIEVRLMQKGVLRDTVKKRIGLRTMTVDTAQDELGRRFTHVVNGVHIFAMGANYIPQDSILGRNSYERAKTLLSQCKECHFNLIRVWGGGYYPDDYFYDLCDEMGLIVWQDFMFACGIYPLNTEFEENISEEIRQNVKRIRHHPCLGLWCGNNEIEMCIERGDWFRNQRQKADYLYINEYRIPKILKELDPQTFYWPSSPSSEGGFDNPNDENRGDGHYWEVWHGGAPFPEFRKHYFRYLSEFGFQSFPNIQTVARFTRPEDRNIFSYVMEKHQRNGSANGKILNYLSQTFLYPNSFELLVYASQLLQAEAIRYGVEHFRRNRGRCMGTVYWQLNDCWPVASWSSIDYFGSWKALQYYAKRFYEPILLSCEEEGCLTQGLDVNTENCHIEKSAAFSVTNETMEDQSLEVTWSLRDPAANVLEQGAFHVRVPSLSVWTSERISFQTAELRKNYLSYELWKGDSCLSQASVLFCPPKHFEFEDPELELEIQGDKIWVKAKKYAKSVEIYSDNSNLRLSDNYFDMNAGIKEIQLLDGKLGEIRARSVYDIS